MDVCLYWQEQIKCTAYLSFNSSTNYTTTWGDTSFPIPCIFLIFLIQLLFFLVLILIDRFLKVQPFLFRKNIVSHLLVETMSFSIFIPSKPCFYLSFIFLCLTPALFVLYYIPVISFLRLYSLYRQNRPHVFSIKNSIKI